MTNITTVTLNNGVPTGPAGAATVSTLDALMADGGQATLGSKADAASAATNATPISAMQALKQISLSAQAAAASLAGTVQTSSNIGAISTGENHIGAVGGASVVVNGNFTRPANGTAYAFGALVANNTSAGSVVPISLTVARKNDGSGMLVNLRLQKTSNSLTSALFRVHFFRNSPTTTVGDGGTFAGAINGLASVEMGYYDMTMDQQHSDGAKGYAQIPNKVFVPTSGGQTIFALIESRATYTPLSGEVFTLTVEALQD